MKKLKEPRKKLKADSTNNLNKNLESDSNIVVYPEKDSIKELNESNDDIVDGDGDFVSMDMSYDQPDDAYSNATNINTKNGAIEIGDSVSYEYEEYEVIADNSNAIHTSSLEISTLDMKENLIFSQFCEQGRIMRSASLTNGEKEITMPVSIDGKCSGEVVAAIIEADGNCLACALAHQIGHNKLDSDAHENLTKKIRKDSVSYIKKHIDSFSTDIIWRSDFEKKAVGGTADEKLNNFLDKLASTNLWCGTETIVAISRLYSVNIIIFNEAGTCYTVDPFNLEYSSCAFIIFCAYQPNTKKKKSTNQKRKLKLDHYNSITKIDQKTVCDCMNKILARIRKTGIDSHSITLE